MNTLNVAIFIVSDKLNLTWKKPIPMTKSKIYELNQMFNLKFYEDVNYLVNPEKTTLTSQANITIPNSTMP